ncbi:hypothetical protein J6590_069519 [Homalodisca vitripennis]|nr:hypothetical protein J6590_069519 [Homalodisca vitripennis]
MNLNLNLYQAQQALNILWRDTVEEVYVFCVICLEKSKHSKSRFWCSGCNAGIHPDCYKVLKHFWRAKGHNRKRKAPDAAESDS